MKDSKTLLLHIGLFSIQKLFKLDKTSNLEICKRLTILFSDNRISSKFINFKRFSII